MKNMNTVGANLSVSAQNTIGDEVNDEATTTPLPDHDNFAFSDFGDTPVLDLFSNLKIAPKENVPKTFEESIIKSANPIHVSSTTSPDANKQLMTLSPTNGVFSFFNQKQDTTNTAEPKFGEFQFKAIPQKNELSIKWDIFPASPQTTSTASCDFTFGSSDLPKSGMWVSSY